MLNAEIVNPQKSHQSSIIWLHGLGADGHDFVPIVEQLEKTTQLGVKFIFPHAPERPVTINDGMRMRAWYDIQALDLRLEEDTQGIHASADSIEALIENEIKIGIPAEKIILAGFSQGGAITYQVGLRYHQKLAGLLALSTYLPLAASVEKEAHEIQKDTPIMIAHGLSDPVIPIIQAQHSYQQLLTANYTAISWHEYQMPHTVITEQITDIDNWLYQCLNQS